MLRFVLLIFVVLNCFLATQCVESVGSTLGNTASFARHPRQTIDYYFSGEYTIVFYIGICLCCCCITCSPVIIIGIGVCIALVVSSKRSIHPSHILTTTTVPQATTYPHAGYAYPHPPVANIPNVLPDNYPGQTDSAPPPYSSVLPLQQETRIL